MKKDTTGTQLLQIEIGDYVFTKNGKFVRIDSDDMPGLPHADIERKATDEENPSFEFHLKFGRGKGPGYWSNLDAESFFTPFLKRCPLAIKSFLKWLNQYQPMVQWDSLFNFGSPHYSKQGWHNPNFYNVPWEMQFGVLQSFFSEKMGDHNLSGDWDKPNELVDTIIFFFIQLEVEIRNGDAEI